MHVILIIVSALCTASMVGLFIVTRRGR